MTLSVVPVSRSGVSYVGDSSIIDSGPLGPLDPPFADSMASAELPRALDVGCQFLESERRHIEKRITELEQSREQSQKLLDGCTGRRTEATIHIKAIEAAPAQFGRSQILTICQEYASAEVAFAGLRDECEHLTFQIEMARRALKAIGVALNTANTMYHLHHGNPSTDETERMATFASLLAAREYERHVLARHIEEYISSTLAAGLQQSHHPSTGNLADDSTRAAMMVTDLHRTLRDALHKTQVLIFELEPAIGDLGLTAALHSYIHRLIAAYGVKIVARIDQVILRFHIAIERAIFRMACEAIANAMRHSDGLHICVALRQQGDSLILTIEDDGKGFDVDSVLAQAARNHAAGFGRLFLEADLIGAEIGIESAPGKGTRIDYIVAEHPDAQQA